MTDAEKQRLKTYIENGNMCGAEMLSGKILLDPKVILELLAENAELSKTVHSWIDQFEQAQAFVSKLEAENKRLERENEKHRESVQTMCDTANKLRQENAELKKYIEELHLDKFCSQCAWVLKGSIKCTGCINNQMVRSNWEAKHV